MRNKESAVSVKALKKIYRNGTKATDGVELNIVPGKVNALLGPNGAGKSTTLKSILGLISYQGKIEVFGKNIDEVRERISFVPEDKSFYDNLTPEKAVKLCGLLMDNFDREKAIALIKEMNLPMNKKISSFSHGMRTSIYLAIAIAQDADLYIFDEPTWGLDPVKRDEVLKLVKKLAQSGKTVLYTSHIIPEIQKIADSISIMYKGKIRYNGDREDIESNYKIYRISKEKSELIDKKKCLAFIREDDYIEVLTCNEELKSKLSNNEDATELNSDLENFFQLLVRGCGNVL